MGANATRFWEDSLRTLQAGGLPQGWTPKTGNIPTFDAWRAANYRPATSLGGMGKIFTDLGSGGTDSAEAQYAKQFYNLPSYGEKFGSFRGLAPILTAAALPVAAAAGAFGGAGAGALEGATASGTLEGAAASGAVAPEYSLAGGATGYGTGGTAAIPAAAPTSSVVGSTPLSRLLGLGQTGTDILGVTGSLAPSVLGYFGADKVSDAYRDVANQGLSMGGPARTQLRGTYTNPNYLDERYGDLFDRAAERAARRVSPRGNPAGNPTLQAEILSDVWRDAYLPTLFTERGQLMQEGGLGLNTYMGGALGGAANAGGQYDAIGLGLGRTLTPKPTLADLMREYRLTVGGV